MKMSIRTFLNLATILLLGTGLWGQPVETEQQKAMAVQMAHHMDKMWKEAPEDGKANLRLQFLEHGEPFSGVVSVQGRFNITLKGTSTQTINFNPNSNGRYVIENLEPGVYHIRITGIMENEGFDRSVKDVNVRVGDSTVMEIELR